MEIAFYFLSFLIVILNLVSIIMQKVSFKKGYDKTGASGTAVAFTSIADILCGIYLSIVWIADLIF